jgi:hypothetical protein
MMIKQPSGGGFRKLDVSWRQAKEPIEVLCNPWGPQAPRMIEDLTKGRTGHRGVRFQLNALGFVWFADAHVAMHGDESRGRLLPERFDGKETTDQLFNAPTLVYGYITFPEWKLEANDPMIDLAYLHAAYDMLPLFKRWRQAVGPTILNTWSKT